MVRDEIVRHDRRTLRTRFINAEPFPHIVIDDFLSPTDARVLSDTFPHEGWDGWEHFADGYQAGKRACRDIAVMPEAHADLIRELSEPAFLDLLTAITGIDALIPDPHLEGGGLHASGEGGVLVPHTDFHLYPRLRLHRRLNLLLYLNDWAEGDGGQLGLWHKGSEDPAVVIAPVLGRAVLFQTDDRSVHGFATPVASGRTRKSIALYYYTADESPDYSGDTTTYWQRHSATSAIGRLRMRTYRALILVSRAVAMAAHRVNPTLTRGRRDRT